MEEEASSREEKKGQEEEEVDERGGKTEGEEEADKIITDMALDKKSQLSSDMCGRGSRSRVSSTSADGHGEQDDEFKAMIHALAMGVQRSTAAANATANAVALMR